jgi:hypothetical protein
MMLISCMSGKNPSRPFRGNGLSISTFVGQNVGQTGGYGVVIARFLSYNCQNQAQNNTVVVQEKEMDRVGFEPTTSASLRLL